MKSVLSDKDNTKFCIRCGMENSADADYCVLCGEQLYINNKNDYLFFCSGRIRRRRTALVLCAVLGIFGVHKFYEKKLWTGILYMFTGGILIIGVITDFINLLSKPEIYYI